MTEIQIVLSTDNSFLARLARFFGAEYTHAMLRFLVDTGYPCTLAPEYGNLWQHHIIEATMRSGVIERAWHPGEYTKWAAHHLGPEYTELADYEGMLAFARGCIGHRYAFEWLPSIAIQIIRKFLKNLSRKPTIAVAGIPAGLVGTGEICSSFVDRLFYAWGFDLVPEQETFLVTPDEIARSPLLQLASPDGTIEYSTKKGGE